MYQIAILMYHKVGAPVVAKRDRFLNVQAATFARQMRALDRLGFRALTLAEAATAVRDGKPLPRRAVCYTFDDAYRCVYDFAAPILARRGHPATVYVPTARVGDANRWDASHGVPVLPIMGWEELQALQDAGWEVGGHTRTHPRLGDLADDAATDEIAGGLSDLETVLGRQARTFCYPYGSRNERTHDLVSEAGYVAACTTVSGMAGPASDPFLLPRVKVAYRDGVIGLLYRLLIRPHLP